MKLKSVKSQLCPDYGFIWNLQHENSVESLFEVQNIKKGEPEQGALLQILLRPDFQGQL